MAKNSENSMQYIDNSIGLKINIESICRLEIHATSADSLKPIMFYLAMQIKAANVDGGFLGYQAELPRDSKCLLITGDVITALSLMQRDEVVSKELWANVLIILAKEVVCQVNFQMNPLKRVDFNNQINQALVKNTPPQLRRIFSSNPYKESFV